MAKKKPEEVVEVAEAPAVPSEKDKLYALLEELQVRNIRSIGDLENQIARLN